MLPVAVAGEQAIFSYPAIIIATLLYGARAGSVAGIICLPFLWYFVVAPRRSFATLVRRSFVSCEPLP